MVFLTSDTHFGHESIIRFCHRPFQTVEEMNQVMIDRWNATVSADDDVYHLGDFAFGSKYVKSIVPLLNGRIHLILGNHDYKNIVQTKLTGLFHSVSEAKTLKTDGMRIFLSHYPYLCWPGTYRKSPQFHGHVHLRKGYSGLDREALERVSTPHQYDVGVDLNDFRPLALSEAIERINAQVAAKLNCYNMWCM